MVTSGAAGAMAAATAACIAGKDQANIWQLPDTTGLKNEVIMLGGRSPFDSAIRLVGAKLVIAPSHAELQASRSQTRLPWSIRPGEMSAWDKLLPSPKRLGSRFCWMMPPASRPSRIFPAMPKLGVDLYCFSGGKGLRGPQCSGLLLGRKDLDRSSAGQLQPLGRRGLPGHEGWQGRDHRRVDRCRSVVANRSEQAQ